MTLQELDTALKALKEAGVDMNAEVMILSELEPCRVMQVVAPMVLLEKDIHKYRLVSLGFTRPVDSIMPLGFSAKDFNK